MKGFFAKLFGKQTPPADIQKRAEPASVTASQQPLFEPYKIGDLIAEKYEVQRVLGKGGFGIVYLVRLRETGEAYALKTFKDEITTDHAALAAFKREALVWVNLERHPFILPAIWVEEIRYGHIATPEDDGALNLGARQDQSACGRLLVVMDYVAADANGRASLGDHLGSGPIDENQVLRWGIQFCLGMEHARARGVECHRDIKPANILITQDGTLKVSDFGLSLATEAALRGTVGQANSLNTGSDGHLGFSVARAGGKVRCGTPGYMAPEVFRYDGATVRSDIYSFGLVLWQMATGSRIPPFHVPWQGDAEQYMSDVYEQQMTGRIPRLEGALGTVIERCLRAEPSQRYGTFAELRGALDTILERKTGRKLEIPDLGEKTAAFWNNKGGALAALGRQEEAIRCYDKALEIEPRAPQAWNNKGSALSALDRNEDALRCYDKALAIDPRFSMAVVNKGRSLHILGNREEALRCFDQALSLESRTAGTWQGKGAVLATMGQHADAVACFDKALAIAPQTLDAL